MNRDIEKILLELYDKENREETAAYGTAKTINLSPILDKLIHSAGRFCLSFASDLFVEWNVLLDYIKTKTKQKDDERKLFVFAMRKRGVDDENFFIENLKDINKYMEIFFVTVQNEGVEYISTRLKNMSDTLTLADINTLLKTKVSNPQAITADDDLPFD